MKKNVLDPLIRRAGTALAGYLITLGVAVDPAHLIAYAAMAAAGVAVDLFNSYADRERK